MAPTTLFEIASLSKTVLGHCHNARSSPNDGFWVSYILMCPLQVGVLFSMEYFRKHGIKMDTPVNELLVRVITMQLTEPTN